MSKNKLKILYVANVRMPNLRAHGIQIANTCEGIGHSDIDVTLLTPYFYGDHTALSSHFGISQSFKHKKIFAIDIPGIPFRYSIRNFSFFIAINIYLLLVLLIISFSKTKLVIYVRGEVVLALIPLMYVTPIFFETHQIRNYERLYKMALKKARGIIVVTQSLKTKFIEECGLTSKKILVARDAVDNIKFGLALGDKKIWSQYGIEHTKKIILYSGTLSVEKGVNTLADASQYVMDNVHIVFLGGTEEQVVLFKKKYGNIKNISILGRVSYSEVPKHIVAADVLVIPDLSTFSYNNLFTSPMKLFEYMASGRPIVAAKVPSLLEVLATDTAVFFESNNPVSLAQSITQVLENDMESAARATRAKEVVLEFTWDKRAQAIVKHIQSQTSLKGNVI